ncbi:arylsulfatase [Halosquirtibacter xylanolyticus]|uniref:sulfatase family protein n=1 Tax=Halosquirtibacter xylanolyticus TaxID=3374599 RepID=UPI0037496525|nr:arylsulfatase [Prolixibacteraceae bacterium]
MNKHTLLFTSFALCSAMTSCSVKKKQEKEEKVEKPNIVVIYLDDLGYGDLSCYGADAISTPNMDALANGGVRFTNGHSTSATCTPSRYGLLTGEYPWRNAKAKILPGSAPLLINPKKMTLPKMLKTAGYHTGIVGKWHLGLGAGDLDWNKEIKPGPNEVGFDDSYIMAATQDRVPTVYIENDHVDNLDPNDPISISYKHNFDGQPTGKNNPEMLKLEWHHGHNNTIVNGIPRIGFMKGGKAAHWKDEEMADHFLAKAKAYVDNHKDEPFFLYYALQQPHVPRTPSPRFVGKSGLGARGDVILEADWCVGEFIKHLKEKHLLENTLIVLSSDNGPVLNDGYKDQAVELNGNHKATGPYRGGKYSLYEAGTRVPFICYWKGKIEPKVSNALVCQVDLMSSFAHFVGSDIRGKDSKDILGALLGKSDDGRKGLVLEAFTRTAYEEGDWVMIPPHKGAAINKNVNIELGNSKEYQLYNLKDDIHQQVNLATKNKEKLDAMVQTYNSIVHSK